MNEEEQRLILEKNSSLEEEIKELRNAVSTLTQQLDYLKRQLFGQKSEKLDSDQPSLFDVPGKPEDAPEEDPGADSAKGAAEKTKKKRKIRSNRLPDHLPINRVELTPQEVLDAPQDWRRIGEDITTHLEKDPGYFYKVETVRGKYVPLNNPHQAPVSAPAKPTIIPNGYWGAGLLSEMLCNRYLYALPYFRQSTLYSQRFGVELPRQSMADMAESVATGLEPIYKRMKAQMLSSGYIQSDETPIRYLDTNHPNGSAQGYYWVYRGANSEVIFDWRTNRNHENLGKFLGTSFIGVIQSDGYQAYGNYCIAQRLLGKEVKRAACLAHIRRYFEKSLKGSHGHIARWFMKIIGELYQIEARLREYSCDSETRARIRKIQSKPRVVLLEKAVLHLSGKMHILPQSYLGKALTYARNQLPDMHTYLEHGQVEIDNNLTENALRPTVVGKKNHLFIGSPEAGQYSAVLNSLLLSAKGCGVPPEQYLRDIIERVPTATNNDLDALTPAAWAKAYHAAEAIKVAKAASTSLAA